ncbi:MAG: hypothetical protein WCI27_10170 [Candidatus Omnitrophota bacterium]
MVKRIECKTDTAVYQFDPLTGFGGRPDIEGDVAFEGPSGPKVKVRLNAYGDRDEPFEAMPGVKNILCYGGSITWGAYIEQDRRYTDVLNRRVKDCRFINLGNGSFGLDQVCLSILERSGRYSPSMFVIEQFPWALHRVLNPCVYGYIKPAFFIDNKGCLQLRKVPPLARYKAYRKIEEGYRLYKKELMEFKGGVDIKAHYDPLADPIFLAWKTTYYDYMYLLIEKILGVIQDHCAQKKCRLLFMIIPYTQQFGFVSGSSLVDYELPAKRFKALLEKLRIDYIDAAPPMVKAHSPADPVIKPDGHANDRGHVLLADILQGSLVERGVMRRAA